MQINSPTYANNFLAFLLVSSSLSAFLPRGCTFHKGCPEPGPSYGCDQRRQPKTGSLLKQVWRRRLRISISVFRASAKIHQGLARTVSEVFGGDRSVSCKPCTQGGAPGAFAHRVGSPRWLCSRHKRRTKTFLGCGGALEELPIGAGVSYSGRVPRSFGANQFSVGAVQSPRFSQP